MCLCAYSLKSAAENVISRLLKDVFILYLSVHCQGICFILAVLCEWLHCRRMYVFLMQVSVHTMYCNMSCWWMYHYISLTYLCGFIDYLENRMQKRCLCAVNDGKHCYLTRSILSLEGHGILRSTERVLTFPLLWLVTLRDWASLVIFSKQSYAHCWSKHYPIPLYPSFKILKLWAASQFDLEHRNSLIFTVWPDC